MHEYSKTISRFYDSVYDELRTPVDRDFYLEQIANAGGLVLEVGVGTGRIFCEALEKGADIYGIDLSENMLQVLNEKLPQSERGRVMQADMRNFDLGRKFNLIIVPFRIFQHMLTIDDQLAALKSMKKHLDAAGRLIFDVFVPDPDRIKKPVFDMLEFEGKDKNGREFKRLATIKPDYINQLLNITFTFKWNENGKEMSENDVFPFRYFFRYELEHLIARSGLKIEKIYGDFKGGELSNQSNDFIVICRG